MSLDAPPSPSPHPPLYLGVAFADRSFKGSVAINEASPPVYGHHRKAWTPAGHVDDPPAVDAEASLSESGIECRRSHLRLRENFVLKFNFPCTPTVNAPDASTAAKPALRTLAPPARGWDATLIERRSNALQARYAGHLECFWRALYGLRRRRG
jgi:hypothetical protein